MISDNIKEISLDNTDLKNRNHILHMLKEKSNEMNLGSSIRIIILTGIAVLCGVILLLVFLCNGSGTRETNSQPEEVSQVSLEIISLKSLLSVAISVSQAGGRELVAVRNEADIIGEVRVAGEMNGWMMLTSDLMVKCIMA